MTDLTDTPASLAARPLYEPISELLAGFTSPTLPGPDELTQALEAHAGPAAVSETGHRIRFVAPPGDALAYEAHIHATGEVPPRPGNWHDFFNALAWCAWPQTKAALNMLHVREQRARAVTALPGRGPRRDALTQFDECGILVISSEPEILALLSAHRWVEAFWRQRERLIATTRFLVLGHGTWDQLRRPFFGLCARALYRTVDASWLALPERTRQAEADNWLATHISASHTLPSPRALSPLPLLGIPGVTPENASAAYYMDERQFRPPRVR